MILLSILAIVMLIYWCIKNDKISADKKTTGFFAMNDPDELSAKNNDQEK